MSASCWHFGWMSREHRGNCRNQLMTRIPERSCTRAHRPHNCQKMPERRQTHYQSTCVAEGIANKWGYIGKGQGQTNGRLCSLCSTQKGLCVRARARVCQTVFLAQQGQAPYRVPPGVPQKSGGPPAGGAAEDCSTENNSMRSSMRHPCSQRHSSDNWCSKDGHRGECL